MKKILALLTLIIFTLLITSFVSFAQPAPLVYAALVDGNVFIYGLEDQPTQVTTYDQNEYETTVYNMIWRDNGQQMAFVTYVLTPNMDGILTSYTDLVIVDIATKTIMTPGLHPSLVFPISFLDDGRLMYAEEGDYVEGNMGPTVNIYFLVPDSQSQPELAGSFVYGAGCGGGSPYPIDILYSQETGGFGGYTMLLAYSDIGLLHSADCSGSGVMMVTENGTSSLLVSDINRVKISSNGERLVGISDEGLVAFDLGIAFEKRIALDFVPDQLAWGTPESNDIFYSVINPSGSIPLDANGTAAFANLIGYEETEVALFQAAIHRYNLVTGEDTILYNTLASAIGRMMVTDDGSQLIFSLIPNPNAWVDALIAGQLGTMENPNLALQYDLLAVEVVSYDLVTQQVTVIGRNQNKMVIR